MDERSQMSLKDKPSTGYLRRQRSKLVKEKLYESASKTCKLEDLRATLDKVLKAVSSIQSSLGASTLQVPQCENFHSEYISNYFAPTANEYPYAYIPDCGEELCANSKTVLPSQGTRSFEFRAEAREFIPGTIHGLDSFKSSPDFRSLPNASWERIHNLFQARGQEEECSKCSQQISECICDEILCRSCMRTADNCLCPTPEIRKYCCNQCYAPEYLLPCFALPEECVECGATDFVKDDFNFITQSEQMCEDCKRHDQQRSIRECNGKGCGKLFHEACMVEVPSNQRLDDKRGDLFVCRSCSAEGVPLESNSDTESSFEDQSQGPLDKAVRPEDSVHECSVASDGSAPKHENPRLRTWGDEEILIWMQVTLRMASSASGDRQRQAGLIQRWKAARDHIPSEKRERMQTMLEDKFAVSLNK